MSPSPRDVIHRYEIPIDGLTHRFTIGRGPLRFACRKGDRVEFWAYAPTGISTMDRHFTIIGTGHPLPIGSWHVGTVLAPNSDLVWHVLEVVLPPAGEVSDERKVSTDVTVHTNADPAAIGAEIGRAVRRARRDGI